MWYTELEKFDYITCLLSKKLNIFGEKEEQHLTSD